MTDLVPISPQGIVLYALFVALAALIGAVILRGIVFRTRPHTLRRLFLSGVAGEILGFVILSFTAPSLRDAGLLLPLLSMVLGLLAGSLFLILRKRP